MAADYDLIVRGGMVVDGTGLPRRRVDVGVRDGRIAAPRPARRRAARPRRSTPTGMIVAPGIVDAHTHYDPQITFDPYATVSCFHGVTTVLAGNCGFSVAPCTRRRTGDFLSGHLRPGREHGPDRADRDHLGPVRDVPRVPREPRAAGSA